MSPLEILRKYFGFSGFRSGQEEIINNIIAGDQVIAVLPTGGGKSLCYQIPAIMAESFSIVISPLISLMRDQTAALAVHENLSAYINSTVPVNEEWDVYSKIDGGQLKILYLSPEKLANPELAERLKRMNPVYLFVDEAHCIDEWGESFRPAYKKIKFFSQHLGIRKISAFTATATPSMIQSIATGLELEEYKLVVHGFERKNLFLNSFHSDERKDDCLKLIRKCGEPALIYSSTRRKAQEIAEFLKKHNINCAYYHAGLEPERRRKIQDDFMSDRLPIIVATKAFGMGIDKKNIRTVIHYNMPPSIEEFYQEIGRSGRDSEPAVSYLIYSEKDDKIHRHMINMNFPDDLTIRKVYNAVCDSAEIPLGKFIPGSFELNFKYINSYSDKKITESLAESSLRILEEAGYIKTIDDLENKIEIGILTGRENLDKVLSSIPDKGLSDLLLTTVRIYGNQIFNSPLRVSYSRLSDLLETDLVYLDNSFRKLYQSGLVSYRRIGPGQFFRMEKERVDDKLLLINYGKLKKSRQNAIERLETMKGYATTGECRMKYILDYFGEIFTDFRCHRCDNCGYIYKSETSSSGKKSADGKKSDSAGYEENLEVFNRLREIRLKASKKFAQPIEMICPDQVLRNIAESRPSNPGMLLKISGMNDRIFRKLGKEILDELRRIASEKLQPGILEKDKKLAELLEEGYSLEDIAALLDLTQSEVSVRIEGIIEYYPELNIAPLFKGGEWELITDAMKEEFSNLRELRNRLKDKINFAKLRIAAAKMRATR